MKNNFDKNLEHNSLQIAAGEEEIQSTFPSLLELENLIEDHSLPAIQILCKSKNNNNNSFNITFELPKIPSKVDVYLFSNDKKKDMFYGIKGGVYTFKNLLLPETSKVEILYRFGKRKSISSITDLIIHS